MPFISGSYELLHQLQNVLRLKVGDTVNLFDGSGYDFIVRIKKYEDQNVSFEILEKRPNSILPLRETYLLASIVKKDNFEWIAEKATELGVSHIIPILSERTEKKDINKTRLQKIVVEASEQSGRGTVPIIHEVTSLGNSLKDAINLFGKDTEYIAFHLEGEKFDKKELKEKNPIAIFIGPEGGWSPDEISWFKENYIPIKTLGPQILRAETAVIASLSQIVF